jgi:hypothetical protein
MPGLETTDIGGSSPVRKQFLNLIHSITMYSEKLGTFLSGPGGNMWYSAPKAIWTANEEMW